MSSNDVRIGMYSSAVLDSHLSTLTRSATTSSVVQSSKAFGERTTMNKEDHDRERMRWFLRLEEIESRLADSERLNSDMHQIRAELNKKIVELEKSQRPLIEQNRKVNERNKALQQEVKKLEQKLCHTQDDYLTLKNAHEKLMKEHVQLKEKRAYPEKLEELERYRAQVLEYSKCITALRSSGLERDRRYELLVQKFKRLRRCVRKDVEDDRQSLVGSDCSAESSVNLDKIAEDLESFNTDIELNYQTLYRENTELQKEIQELKLSPALLDENLLRDQLKCANTTIAQQQFHINNNKNMVSQIEQLKIVVASQLERIRQLEQRNEEMERELCASREAHDLLEFQVLENEENSKCINEPTRHNKCLGTDGATTQRHDKCSATDDLSEANSATSNENNNLEQSEDLQSKRKRKKLQELETEELRKKVIESDSIRENMAEEMRTTSKELTKLKIKLQNRESELEQEKKLAESLNQQLQAIVQTHQMVKNTSSRTEEELAKTKTSYQECKAKVESVTKEKERVTEELRTMSKELAKLKYKLQTKEAELNQERKLTEGLNQQLQEVVETHQHMKDSSGRTEGELEKAKELYNECKAKVENLEKEKVELKTELDRLSSEYKKFRDEQRPLIRTELERRYEETRYRLNMALEKIHQYELVLESIDKGGDSTLCDMLQQDIIQIREYNSNLERQFRTQTDIIEAMKRRLTEQKAFADLIHRLAELNETGVVQEHLSSYIKSVDRDSGRLAEDFASILRKQAG